MRPISSKPDRDTNVVKEAIARQLKLCRINDDLRINYPNRKEVRTFLYEHLASCTAFEVRTVTDHILLLQSMPIDMHMGDYDEGHAASMRRSSNSIGSWGVPELLPNYSVPFESSEYHHWTVLKWTPDMGIPIVGHKRDWVHLTLLLDPAYRYNDDGSELRFADLDTDTREQLLAPYNPDARSGQEWGATGVTLVWLDDQAGKGDRTYGLRAWTNRPTVKLYKDEARQMQNSEALTRYYKQLRQLMEAM